jgi:class 3 adenylate cyclase
MAFRIPTALRNHCIRALSESMDIRTMTHLIRNIFQSYDIHERTGFPKSIAIPNIDVARQIVTDVIKSQKFLHFVRLLIGAQDDGIMGRRYKISFLREIIKATYDLGYIFDSSNMMFIENPQVRKTRNWGALEEGEQYQMVFLAIDIVENSRLVKTYPPETIKATYKHLRAMMNKSIDKRNGRIWSWEGDGGLAAFFFGDPHTSAALSAIEIMNELFLYNRAACVLNEPLVVRIGVHAGDCEYTASEEELDRLETISETRSIETMAKPDTVYLSIVVKVMLDEFISKHFKAVGTRKNGPFCYSLKLE